MFEVLSVVLNGFPVLEIACYPLDRIGVVVDQKHKDSCPLVTYLHCTCVSHARTYNIKDLLGYYMYVMIPENELDTRNMQQRKLSNWCQVVQKMCMCVCVCVSLSLPPVERDKEVQTRP